MKIVLVNPPNNYDDAYELAPPLGLLSLAAAVAGEGVDVAILDFNLLSVAEHDFVDHQFYEKAVDAIAAEGPDLVGFTSMVVNSHVTLELARRVRIADREVVTVLGGTHFSAIAEDTLALYKWIDFVVTGEAEIPLRELVAMLRRGNARAEPPAGVAYRDGERIVVSHRIRPFGHADELPHPAYDLVDLRPYFALNPDRVIDYEPGRGCVYKCSFCYSPVHYGSGAQPKTADRIVADMQRLQDLGAGHLFFVQDNFLNNARMAKEICAAISDANLSLTWNCYTTLPQMTTDVLAALGRAGCVNAFTGVDAVNEECQREYLKRFYRGWEALERTLRTSVDHGVTPTCAFLVENPSAGIERVDRTLSTALFARCCGAGLRLNTLTLYNGTASAAAMRGLSATYSELKPRLLLDCPPLVEVNDYARDRPDLFPFHSTFLPPEVWTRFAVGMHIAYTLFHTFPMTLYRWVTEDGGSLWTMIDGLAAGFDLSAVAADERRPLERSLFIRWFEQQARMQRLTAETFDLERAEWSVRVGEPARTVRLGYGVPDLHRFDLQRTPLRGESRPVVVTRRGDALEYDEITSPIPTERHGAVPLTA
jgi:radical SAM superfamily enzyme YgiQ (UPF0313 family)